LQKQFLNLINYFHFYKKKIMNESQIKHFDKILRVFYKIQSKRQITKTEIVEELQISERTFYRYIKELVNAGFPITCHKDGYSLNEGESWFDMKNIKFTENETISFLIANKLVQNYSDDSIQKNFETALEKIKISLKYPKYKQNIENLDNKILSPQIKNFNKQRFPNNYLINIQNAILNFKILKINYFIYEKNQKTERNIYPLELRFLNNIWHLIAYCTLRNDYREFRLDRIEKLNILTQNFDNEIFTIEKYEKSINLTKRKTKITLKVDKKIERLMHLQKYNYGFESEKEIDDRFYEIIFKTSHPNDFCYWLLIWTDNVEITKPKYLINQVKKLAKITYEFYKKF